MCSNLQKHASHSGMRGGMLWETASRVSPLFFFFLAADDSDAWLDSLTQAERVVAPNVGIGRKMRSETNARLDSAEV